MGWPSTSLSTWARAQSASMRTIGFAASLLDLHISVMSPNPSTPSQPAISLPLSRYCHKVAGLVGEGLSRAFVVRGLESAQICGQGAIIWPFCPAPKASPVDIMFSALRRHEAKYVPTSNPNETPLRTQMNPDMTLGLANSMGLFLQKTNIIRDYLEDYVDGRAFWPQEVTCGCPGIPSSLPVAANTFAT